jgi:hypothetical protein
MAGSGAKAGRRLQLTSWGFLYELRARPRSGFTVLGLIHYSTSNNHQ